MTTQMNQWNVNEAIFACPALVEFRLVCEEAKGEFAVMLSTEYMYRFVVNTEDALWVLEYWRNNGVYGDLPLDAPISLLSMKQMTRLAVIVEQVASDEDRNVAPADAPILPIALPAMSIPEGEHSANIATIAELTLTVSRLMAIIDGMKLESDTQEEIIVSSDRELERLNALLSLSNKTKKRKPLAVEQIAILWLRLPKTAENLVGITTCKSGGYIAHTSYTDLWFATVKHAQGFMQAWSIEGERPSLSNLRIGMKPMKGDEDV